MKYSPGHLDALRGRSVLGWARCADRPGARVTVQALVDGALVAEAVANQHRPDLQDAGYGDGSHGYALLLPEHVMDGEEHILSIRTKEGVELVGSPKHLVLPNLQVQPVPPDAHGYAAEIAICAIAKNEGPYLLEWIAFHRVIGVERFLIFDNESTDGTADILRPLQAACLLELIPWPTVPGQPPQIPAYMEGLRRLRSHARWIAFIDLDEFLHPLAEDSPQPVLRSCADAAGLVVPWRIFGSSGEQEARDDLVIRRFTRRAAESDPVNHAVKTIVRGRLVKAVGVHTPQLDQGSLVDENGDVAGSFGDPDRHPVPGAAQIVLHHYFCKSRAEWSRKRLRGRATRSAADASHIRPDSIFTSHDRNEVEDTRILRFEAAVREEMRRLASL